MTITVTQKHTWPIRCFTCRAEIGDHMVKADGDVFCSQGCALMAGCYETSPCSTSDQPK